MTSELLMWRVDRRSLRIGSRASPQRTILFEIIDRDRLCGARDPNGEYVPSQRYIDVDLRKLELQIERRAAGRRARHTNGARQIIAKILVLRPPVAACGSHELPDSRGPDPAQVELASVPVRHHEPVIAAPLGA